MTFAVVEPDLPYGSQADRRVFDHDPISFNSSRGTLAMKQVAFGRTSELRMNKMRAWNSDSDGVIAYSGSSGIIPAGRM